jgi:hypothetical protein
MPRLKALDNDKNGVKWDIRRGGHAECTVWVLERLQNARQVFEKEQNFYR